MSDKEPRLPDYLGHILDAIDRITRYTLGMDQATFLANEMVQDAVIRNFEIIGEASRNIDRRHPEFTASHPDLALGDAYRFRNAVIHGYFTVDLGIVWKTIHSDLPGFRAQIQGAQDSISNNAGHEGMKP